MMKGQTEPPVLKQSLADELVERLQTQILDGMYDVGAKLPAEPELMRIFGVGRSTVREAVKRLAHRGLLKVRQGAGTFVESRAVSAGSVPRRADMQDRDGVCRMGKETGAAHLGIQQEP